MLFLCLPNIEKTKKLHINKGFELSMAKNNFIKTKIATIASTLMLTSVDVSALGLGVLNVQSNLDQPLNAIIEYVLILVMMLVV